MEFEPDFFNQNDPLVKSNLGQQDFLRLMMAQIQNWDSMQLQKNDGFLSQLAQSGANYKHVKMQESLQQMTTSLQSNQALQASALVGRKVLVISNHFKLDAGNDVKIAVDLPLGIIKLKALFYAESGELVKIIPLSQSEPGLFQFSWDGIGEDNKRLNEGKYKIEVQAMDVDSEVSLKTMIYSNIDSVSLDQNSDGLKLNVAGIGSVSLDQVRQISV